MPLTEDLQMTVSFIVMLITIGTAVWSWFTAGPRKNEKQIQQQNEVISAQDRRIDALENTVKHLPDIDAVHRMEIMLGNMDKQIGILNERVKPISETTNRLNDLLLDQARKNL